MKPRPKPFMPQHLAAPMMILCFILVGCASGSSETVDASETAASGPASATAVGPYVEVGQTGAEVVTEVAPDWMQSVGDAVWVSGVGPNAGQVGRFDGQTAQMTASVDLSGVCLAMDQLDGNVWAAGCDEKQLVQFDGESGEVLSRVKLPDYPVSESSIAASSDGVWVLVEGDRDLVRIDPDNSAVTERTKAPDGATALRATDGGLWVSRSFHGDVVRIDADSGKATDTVKTDDYPRFMTVGQDSLWVMSEAGSVTRVDLAKRKSVATVEVSDKGISGGDISAGDDSVWARITAGLAVEIDPATNTAVTTIGPEAGSGGIAVTDEAVWISAHDAHTIWRVPTPAGE